MKFLIALLLLGMCISTVQAESLDSIQNLDEVTVTGARLKNFSTGHFFIGIDSLTKVANQTSYLGDLLGNASLFQINHYGTGSVSVSARGMGEKRTPVIWNGFNIQSIISTSTDLGQLPSFFFEDVQSQLGASSALFGSGAGGGILFLNNKGNFEKAVHGKAAFSYGSFENYFGGGQLSASDGLFSTSLKFYYSQGKNNFPYKATYKSTEIDSAQLNAEARQYGLMMNNYLKISDSKMLNLNIWYTNCNKNVAPTLSDIIYGNVSDGTQKDEFTGASAEFSSEKDVLSYYIRSGFFNSRLNYEKPSWMLVSESKTNWSVNEAEIVLKPLQYLKFNGGVNFTYEMASSNSFSIIHERYRKALFSSLSLLLPEVGLTLTGNIRQELIANETIPFTFSGGLEYILLKGLKLKGNFAKNYRLPSFNDLYYVDFYSVGNPDLKPEDGINAELGAEYALQVNSFQFMIGGNGYYSKMNNWINWAERPDHIWSVFNIDRAKIKGFESFAGAGFKGKDFDITGKLMYSYTNAVNPDSDLYITNVPKSKLTFNLQARLNQTSLTFQFTRVGERFSSVDNTEKLDLYRIYNILFTQNFTVGKSSFALDAGVYNLLNNDYMVLNGYPMPKRNARIGLRFSF